MPKLKVKLGSETTVRQTWLVRLDVDESNMSPRSRARKKKAS